jgi:hypothetical protein
MKVVSSMNRISESVVSRTTKEPMVIPNEVTALESGEYTSSKLYPRTSAKFYNCVFPNVEAAA